MIRLADVVTIDPRRKASRQLGSGEEYVVLVLTHHVPTIWVECNMA